MTFETILGLVLLLAPARSVDPTETAPDYTTRLAVIAGSVLAEAELADSLLSTRELVAATLVVWHQETRYSRHVHAGGRGRWGSDNGRATCLGQLHRTSLAPDWDTLAGLDVAATRRCAAATMRVLSAHARSCGRGAAAAWLSGYGTGQGCRVVALGRKRARIYRLALSRLKALPGATSAR